MKRNQFLRAVVGAVAAAAVFGAVAQPLSNRAIKVVVPFGAGGVADLTIRTVAQKMSDNMGQPVIIENKPGAGGVVATDTVVKAAPDGHTLLLMSNGNAVSVGLFKSLPFDTVNDLAPVGVLGHFDLAIIVPAESRFKSLPELLAYAKANPGKLNIASINAGSTQNLAAELFKTSAGIDAQVVPFNGSPAVITALRGNQVDAAVEILAPVLTQITGNTLRALAVTGEKRAAALPNVPTVREGGIASFNVSSWNALAAPAKTPPEILARLNKEVNAALNDPETRKKLANLNVDARPGTQQQLSELLNSEIKRWGAVIDKAGIPKQ